jgi:hypothetical protein
VNSPKRPETYLPDIPASLKSNNRLEPDKYLHILIMSSDGQTRRMSLSISFLWIMGFLALVVVGALGLVTYLWVEAIHSRDFFADNLEYLSRQTELARYSQDVKSAPDQARRLLEELDLAVRSADSAENGEVVKGVADNEQTSAESRNPAGSQVLSAVAQAETTVTDGQVPLGNTTAVLENLSQNITSEINVSASAPGTEATSTTAANLTAPDAKTPESEAWDAFWTFWPPPPSNADPQLDADDFKIASNGQISFILRQVEEPGLRARGRSVIICAVADNRGQVKLQASPEFDLKKPADGFSVGARYNIISSKVVRGQVTVPAGGRLLSVEVLAWDEDTRELVLRKKIKPEER